jgi:primosomal protein N' (replication factor Y)
MDTLFPKLKAQENAEMAQGPFASVAMEDSLDKLLDYSIPQRLVSQIQVGQRVKVPLGRTNRPRFGYVIRIHDSSDYPKIKPLAAIADDRVLLTPSMMELARWMSRYYCAPLGTVIDTMIPSAVKTRIGIAYAVRVKLAKSRDEIQALLETARGTKRRAILARLLQLEPDATIDLHRLAGESGSTVGTIRKLASLGWLTITSEVDLPTFGAVATPASSETQLVLNEDQQKVFDELGPRVQAGGFSVNLLLGITGSGKTEIYLQCIKQVLAAGKQAIVLVPEIALTPQTVRRFTARFGRVAVLHSGLSQTDRHRYWQQISAGNADVVVGARSAVFAPTPRLGMIVVDEEHEASYKQDNAPRYHARDVAVMRSRLEKVPIILGSATPSLETFHKITEESGANTNALAAEDNSPSSGTPGEGRGGDLANETAPSLTLPRNTEGGEREMTPSKARPYHLLNLPRRVRGLELPKIELVDLATERRMRKGIHLFSQRLESLLKSTINAGHQAIILLNRRGYSNFVYCSSCQEPVHCKYCDATMTYHRTVASGAHGSTTEEGLHTGQLHCHYCLAVQPLPQTCAECGKKLSLFGLGTQRVEEELARKIPSLRFARVDSDSMHSGKEYEALLGRFASGEIQVMLGTQMIAKGLDYPNVTLVGVISGDTALALPDFRAAERTFQLITQVAGRAGRGDNPGRVVLQTFLPNDPTIQSALRHDFLGFAKTELPQRRASGLPPFGRMVRIVLRDQDLNKLQRRSEDLAAQFSTAIADQGNLVAMKGPMPAAINRIAGYYRFQILLNAARADSLQRVLAAVRAEGHLAQNDRIAVDVDPVSLL